MQLSCSDVCQAAQKAYHHTVSLLPGFEVLFPKKRCHCLSVLYGPGLSGYVATRSWKVRAGGAQCENVGLEVTVSSEE